jgi:hypothetical protein
MVNIILFRKFRSKFNHSCDFRGIVNEVIIFSAKPSAVTLLGNINPFSSSFINSLLPKPSTKTTQQVNQMPLLRVTLGPMVHNLPDGNIAGLFSIFQEHRQHFLKNANDFQVFFLLFHLLVNPLNGWLLKISILTLKPFIRRISITSIKRTCFFRNQVRY